MKYYIGILVLLFSCNTYAQEIVKETAEKIVTSDKDQKVRTKEKNSEFYAISDSVKIKDRHGRKKTKDFTAHTVIKEKKDQIKFKNKNDGSWMKMKHGKVTHSANYQITPKTDSSHPSNKNPL